MVTINLTPAPVIAVTVSESTISVSLTTTPISVTVSDGFTVAAGDTRYLRRANNLSDLANASTARTNLGVVAKAGDTMTGQLFIDGSADEVQFKTQAHSTQTANIAENQLSDTTLVSGFDERGVLFSDGGTDTTNFFAGAGAGNANATTAIENVCIGTDAGSSLTEGRKNVFLGFKAGDNTTTGDGNFFLGRQAGQANIAGKDNVFIGINSGFNSLAHQSVGIGILSLFTMTGGQNMDNTSIGYISGFSLTSGKRNVFMGANAGYYQTTLSDLFIVASQRFANQAVELTNSILYGVMAAAPANQSLRVNANLYIGGSNLELRLYEGDNYVGFEAPALSADQIWVLPDVDGKAGDVFTTNGLGTISWLSGASEKSWAFRSRSGAFGTAYAGGFYEHSSSANDFSTGPTFGTANAARAAHFFIVTGADTVDELTIRITGTSILDTGGSRATSSTEDIVIPNTTTAGAYYETTKKWLGTVTITIISGTAKICDYGFVKYWDNNNTDFALVGLEATWLGGASDTDPNLILRHHKGTDGNTDFTYTGSGATPPTAIAAMATDHATEDNVINGENGAWKRTDLSVNINGSGKEGTIFEIVTTANKAFELGVLLLRIIPQ